MLASYQAFVLLKAAEPRYLSAQDFQLLHAALGLSTEWLEYCQASDESNDAEELGDFLWYMMLAAYSVNFPVENLPDGVAEHDPESDRNEFDLVEYQLEAFVSLIKKHSIYNKPRIEELRTAYLDLWRAFVTYLQALNESLPELIEANQTKLNQRYASTFTPEESEARRDKTTDMLIIDDIGFGKTEPEQGVLLDNPDEEPISPERAREIMTSILPPGRVTINDTNDDLLGEDQ